MNGCKSALTKTDVFPQHIDSSDKNQGGKKQQPTLCIDLKRRDSNFKYILVGYAEGFVFRGMQEKAKKACKKA